MTIGGIEQPMATETYKSICSMVEVVNEHDKQPAQTSAGPAFPAVRFDVTGLNGSSCCRRGSL